MRKTVFFFVSFRRRAMQAWVLFLVSIERGTPMPDLSLPSLAVGHEPAWEAPCRFLARPGCGTRRCVGPTRANRPARTAGHAAMGPAVDSATTTCDAAIATGEAYGSSPRKRTTLGRFHLYRYDVKDKFHLE